MKDQKESKSVNADYNAQATAMKAEPAPQALPVQGVVVPPKDYRPLGTREELMDYTRYPMPG